MLRLKIKSMTSVNQTVKLSADEPKQGAGRNLCWAKRNIRGWRSFSVGGECPHIWVLSFSCSRSFSGQTQQQEKQIHKGVTSSLVSSTCMTLLFHPEIFVLLETSSTLVVNAPDNVFSHVVSLWLCLDILEGGRQEKLWGASAATGSDISRSESSFSCTKSLLFLKRYWHGLEN